VAKDEKQKRSLVFLDASVIIAAILSPRGGSSRVLSESKMRGFHLITSLYAYEESFTALQQKYPHFLGRLRSSSLSFELIENPPEDFYKQFSAVIDSKDLVIIASAVAAKTNVLLTLDKKHFLLNRKLRKQVAPLAIMTPGDFIQKYFL